VNQDLRAGLRHTLILRIDPSLIVPAVSPSFSGFRDMPPVFATAFMVAFIEWACVEALRPYLSPSERTVGTHINVTHVAATPVGMNVAAAVKLVAVEGGKLRFRVECQDEAEMIGAGTHERAVIDLAKFLARRSKRRQDPCRAANRDWRARIAGLHWNLHPCPLRLLSVSLEGRR